MENWLQLNTFVISGFLIVVFVNGNLENIDYFL